MAEQKNTGIILNGKKLMPPPWLAYPHIERYSIGWRMGSGEEYMEKFWDWIGTLSEKEREEYQVLFPEPVTWRGWWQGEDTVERFVRNEFEVEQWEPGGIPKYSLSGLRREFAAGKTREFVFFWKPPAAGTEDIDESCLSQWQIADFWSVAHEYCCMEQFMMAQKALLFGDDETRTRILACKNPGEIKALGRKVRGFSRCGKPTVVAGGKPVGICVDGSAGGTFAYLS